jgi:integrase
MAHVEDRWYRQDSGRRVKTELYGQGLRYRVRYIGPDGRERSKSFPDREKGKADAFKSTVEADLLRGWYVDPDAGRIALRRFAEEWLAGQTLEETTREAMEGRFRVHVYPHLGDRELRAITPSVVRSWDRALQQKGLATSYRRVLFANLSGLLTAAVDDEKIRKNPCRAESVRRPRPDPRKVIPWEPAQVFAVSEALRARYRLAVTLGAGCGLRQGEVFGLAVDEVEFLRGIVRVERQVKIVRSRLVFALPKGRKTRTVPLPESVALEAAAHVSAYPPRHVTLPWEHPDGRPVTAPLLLTSRESGALNRNLFNSYHWKPALERAGIEPSRENGMHALRHFYASVLLDAGESIKALSEYLGHSDPGFTLRTYTHLMPSSEHRTRRAIDAVLTSSVAGERSSVPGPAP